MKKIILCILIVLGLCGCESNSNQSVSVPTFKYTQFASGGVESELDAIILFENANSTFTRYQVSYTSCTCRDRPAGSRHRRT